MDTTDKMPHRAQDEQPEQLDQTLEAMTAAVEADEARRQDVREFKATAKQLNIRVSPTAHDYAMTMGRITGKGTGRFISDVLEADAAANKDLFLKAKGVIEDAERRKDG